MRTIEVGAAAQPPGNDPATSSAPDSRVNFQTEGRGIVDASGPGFYVVRHSDGELLERLERREPCYVLAPRQIGKSSLRVRAQERLRARGVRCVSVDLTSIGSGASANEWYFSIAAAIGEELGLDTELDAFWNRHRRMSPVRRFRQFLHDVVLEESSSEEPSPVVVFLDEIDVTLSLPFPRDDFFGLIRSTHEARADAPAWRRITFCLIGVAAPLDLVADPERTPFNNSFAVRLDDFTRSEARTFLPGLTRAGKDAEALLDAVLDWTGGHPALTQRLCYWLTRQDPEERALSEKDRADALVRRLFLTSGRIDDPILLDAERRFAGDRPDARIPVMLHLYRRLLHGEPVAVDGNNPRQFGLRIAGLAAERQEDSGTWLRARNRIFAAVFNDTWVEEKLARRFLTEPLQIWKDSGRKDDHVLRGGALDIALAWRHGREDVSPDEEEFLHASMAVMHREQHDRQQAEIDRAKRERAEQQVRAQRRLVTMLAVSVALVAISLIVGFLQYQRIQAALDEAKRRQLQDLETIDTLREAKEARVTSLQEEMRQAQEDLNAAMENQQLVLDQLKAKQAQAEEARRVANEASARTGRSASAEWNSRTLLAEAKKQTEAAEVLKIMANNQGNKVVTAQKRYDEAKKALDAARGVPEEHQGDASVASSVANALEEEQRETDRLREQLEGKESEIATANEEIARLRRNIKEQNEKLDKLSKEREAVRQGALLPRFATPPPPPPSEAPSPAPHTPEKGLDPYE